MASAPPTPDPRQAPAAATPAPGARGGRVPLGLKIAYGAPQFAGAAMTIPIIIHLTIFYSDVVLVPLGLIALAKAVARAFDALTDPLMGWATDRTRTRWGRRRPWMALGAPACALTFVALFSPPDGLTPAAAGAWLLGFYVLYYLFHTVYAIPHYGLGPELTQDYHERSSLFGVSEGFSVGGTLVAAALPGVFVGWLGPRDGYTAFAVLFASLLVLLYWNLVWRVRERPDFVDRPPNPLVPGVRRVMRNRVFRILLAVYVVGSVTGAIPGTLMPYFTTYVLRPEDPNRWIAIFLFLYFGSGALCLPLWVLAARRFGKKATWLASFVTAFTGSFALFFVGPGDLLATSLILVWAGSSFGARLFLGAAIQADVIDYDELYTGKRREAQYGALWTVMSKFTVIPSMSIPLAILASLGYQPNVVQSETVVFAIRVIFALGPAAFALLAFAVAVLYPISESVHRAIWAGIEAHQRGESARDPLTGTELPPPRDRGVDEEAGWFLDHFAPRSLERALVGGGSTLRRGAAAWTVACLAVFGAAVAGTAALVQDLAHEPGFLAVVLVVVAGFAFTAAIFHAVRWRAARAWTTRPPAPSLVRAHLALTAHLHRPGDAH